MRVVMLDHSSRKQRRQRLAAFRIVQESLVNACRHSKNNRLFAELTLEADVFRIHIRDWGPGVDSENTVLGQFGVEGICRRIKLLRGTATIRGVPGEGMCVTVELPLSSEVTRLTDDIAKPPESGRESPSSPNP